MFSPRSTRGMAASCTGVGDCTPRLRRCPCEAVRFRNRAAHKLRSAVLLRLVRWTELHFLLLQCGTGNSFPELLSNVPSETLSISWWSALAQRRTKGGGAPQTRGAGRKRTVTRSSAPRA